jgi:hypothetical protein
MKRILLLISAVAVLLLSCDGGSSYINYTNDSSYTDADNDGIPDVAEISGTSFYGMPLYDWGARTGQPDIFVHVAPMNPATTDAGMMLQKKALDKVVAKFDENGISLHFDVGKYGLYEGYNELSNRGYSDYNLSGTSHVVPYSQYIDISGTSSSFVSLTNLMSEYLSYNRTQIFYFMVMGSEQYTYNGSSGIAYLNDRRFLITLAGGGLGFFGPNPTLGLTSDNFENYVVNNQASTIMHEFGHTLGLRHGGDESQNYKPNYYSIMNYLYQLNGLPRIGTNEWDRYYYERYIESASSPYQVSNLWSDLMVDFYDSYTTDQYETDYSYASLLPLDFKDNAFSDTYNMDYSYGEGGDLVETTLNENLGLRQSGSNPVDWDGDSLFEASVSADINVSDTEDNAGVTTLHDHNDWGNLFLYFNSVSAGTARTQNNDEAEIIIEKIRDYKAIPFEGSF